MMRSTLGDRRAAMRFDLSNHAWGSLETRDAVPIRNIGKGGMLIEASLPPRMASNDRVHLELAEHASVAQGRVAHVTSIRDVLAGDRYLIGYAFVDVEPATSAHIDRLTGSRSGAADVEDGGAASSSAEKRQTSRISVRTGRAYVRSSSSTVQLLDISLGGMLVATTKQFDLGCQGELRAVVAGYPVAVTVAVRREDPPNVAGQRRYATQIIAVSDIDQRHLETALRSGHQRR